MTTVALLNESTVATDSELALYAAAISHQTRYHLAPHWGRGGNIVAIPKGSQPPAGAWVVHVMDTSDQPGALGYHVLDGTVHAYVFAKTDMQYGALLSVTLSHEILEMLLDPDCQRGEQREDNGYWYGLELCDPVEADGDGYKITPHGYTQAVTVSDFILEDWFGDSGGSGRYDYAGHLTKPWQVRPGGYVSVWTGATWTQQQAQHDGSLKAVPLEKDNPRFRTHVRQAKTGKHGE